MAIGAVIGGGAWAAASVPDSNGTIHACYLVTPGTTVPQPGGPNLWVIDPSAGQTCATDSGAPAKAISWNQTGPPGATGARGATGATGPAGHDATVVGGQKLTLPGGAVINIGSVPTTGTVITPLPVTGSSRAVATGSFADGSQTYSFTPLSVSLGTRASGKASHGDIRITKLLDKSSAKLYQTCSTGKHIKKVTIEMYRGSRGTRLVYHLSDVLVSSIQTAAASSGRAVPVESITLSFAKIQISYTK